MSRQTTLWRGLSPRNTADCRDCAMEGRCWPEMDFGDEPLPAVREFIANVNPLSVLTAWNVMQVRERLEHGSDGWVWLDKRKTTRFQLDADHKVIAAERDKKKAFWAACSDVENPVPPDMRPVYWARPGTSLKIVMLAMHNSDTAPVALFDEDDRFVGSIGVSNVLQAVLKKSH